MFNERYRHMSSQIAPSDELLQKTLHAAQKQDKRKYKRARRLMRPAAVVVAACMIIMIAMPALAANVDPVYQVLYHISPSAAQFFMPVHMSDEDNGIRMEVESAYVHGSTAEIYVTMCDTTGQGRIDKTTDLYDSYDINRSFDSICGCSLVDYDEETQTARFYIHIDAMDDSNDMYFSGKYDLDKGFATVFDIGEDDTVSSIPGKNLEGEKITFSVREFLSNKNVYEDIIIPDALEKVTEAEKTQLVDNWDCSDRAKALVPGEPYSAFPIDGIDMTGIGYVDGKLHVQMAMKNFRETDNHGWVYLKDKTDTVPITDFTTLPERDTIVDEDYSLSFDSEDGQTRYYEYVFDIAPEELENYNLCGYFVTSGGTTKGDWRVTFPLEKAE